MTPESSPGAATLLEKWQVERLWQVAEAVCHLPLPKEPDHCHFRCAGRLIDVPRVGMVYEHHPACPSVVAMHLVEEKVFPSHR